MLKSATASPPLYRMSQQCVLDWLGLYDFVLRKPSLASVNATAEIAFPGRRAWRNWPCVLAALATGSGNSRSFVDGRIAGVEHMEKDNVVTFYS